MKRSALTCWVAVLCAYAALSSSRAYADVTIVVDNLDAAGEGFNDPAPITPVFGNSATTVGQARLNAFRYAASLWGQNLKPGASAQPGLTVHVAATFDPLPCTTTSGVLGQAGAETLHSDFPNAPLTGTWYPQALANSLAGVDLDPNTSDISATFNSDVDNPSCLGATRWYYGIDGNPGPGNIDLVTVVLHELAHGLGFQPFLDESTGVRPVNLNDAFLVLLEQHNATPSHFADMTSDAQRQAAMVSGDTLHWLGSFTDGSASLLLTSGVASGHVKMYAPQPVQPGSSVAHFSDVLTPNQLMEPSYTGPNHDLLLASQVLRDIGWRTTASVPLSSPWIVWLASALLLGLGIRRRDGVRSRGCVQGGSKRPWLTRVRRALMQTAARTQRNTVQVYQRLGWLLLGLTLAVPTLARAQNSAECTSCRDANCRNYQGANIDLVKGCFVTEDASFGATPNDPKFIQDRTDLVRCAQKHDRAFVTLTNY